MADAQGGGGLIGGTAIANDFTSTQTSDSSQNAGGATQKGGDLSQQLGVNLTGSSSFTLDQTSPAALAALSAGVSAGYAAISAVAAGAQDQSSRIAANALETAKQTLMPASEQGANFASKLIWPIVILLSLVAFLFLWAFGAARKKKDKKKGGR